MAFLRNVDNQDTLRINIFFVSGAKLFEPSETFGEMKIPEEWVARVLIVGSSQWVSGWLPPFMSHLGHLEGEQPT